MPARKRTVLINAEEGVKAKCQHSTPCSDCPWTKKALPKWLGNMSVDDWIQAAHGETKIECHTLIGAQCAGAAIYRSNVVKRCKDPSILHLPGDKGELVFKTPMEFRAHHSEEGFKSWIEQRKKEGKLK